MPARELNLLNDLIEMAEQVGLEDKDRFEQFQRRGEMILKKVFGEDCQYASELAGMYFGAAWMNPDQEEEFAERQKALNRACDLLQTAREDLALDVDSIVEDGVIDEDNDEPVGIFVVHGHDNELKESVARLIGQLGYEPIILHERPNRGRTIIEKFDDYADVDFAVVLLSPDDLARTVGDESQKYRARQNVIFELGFFLGRIGRENVACVYRQKENFELPSDYDGVLYIPFDASGAWRYRLAQELAEANFDIDMNDLR